MFRQTFVRAYNIVAFVGMPVFVGTMFLVFAGLVERYNESLFYASLVIGIVLAIIPVLFSDYKKESRIAKLENEMAELKKRLGLPATS